MQIVKWYISDIGRIRQKSNDNRDRVSGAYESASDADGGATLSTETIGVATEITSTNSTKAEAAS